MMFDPSAYIPQEELAELLNSISISLGAGGNSFLLGIAAYVLLAMGLYTIANRRAIHHPWMAWVPVLNVWILGSVADQYRYVTKGQVRNSRKALIVLEILKLLAAIGVYYLVNTILSVITQFCGTLGTIFIGAGLGSMLVNATLHQGCGIVALAMLIFTVMIATFTATIHFITQGMLERKLNLA